jgi:glutamate 5-kinase
MKRIVIKIGSSVLAKKNGLLNEKIILGLVSDAAWLKKEKDMDIVIITSGAVSVGKSVKRLLDCKIEAEAIHYDKNIVREQVLAAVGQPKLMAFYIKEFNKYGIECAQVLTTRADFAGRESYLSLRTVTENLLKASIVPIFNENDVLSPEELDFSDNDHLAAMVAAMVAADKIIILSSVEGLYDGSIENSKSKIVPIIESVGSFSKFIDDSSISGKGGMRSKFIIAELITNLGITMHLASGLKKGVLRKIVNGENIGTLFPAKAKKAKALKNWIAAGAAPKGKLVVSTNLADVLKKKRTASVLFLGIEEILGNFTEKDILEVVDDSGTLLGRGVSRFDSDRLRKEVEKYKNCSDIEKTKIKTSKIIAIHYDYFVFQ